jgi:hypothetical protein
MDEGNWSQTFTNGSRVDLKAPIVKSESLHTMGSKNKSKQTYEKT